MSQGFQVLLTGVEFQGVNLFRGLSCGIYPTPIPSKIGGIRGDYSRAKPPLILGRLAFADLLAEQARLPKLRRSVRQVLWQARALAQAGRVGKDAKEGSKGEYPI